MLGSGSSGNAAYLESGGTRILLEAGFSCRDLEARLTALGVDPARIDGILLSHEHGDHARGARLFARKFGTPVAASRGTLRAAGFRAGSPGLLPFESGDMVSLGSLRIATAPIPHDAVDPVAFRIDTPEGRVGFALDLGHAREEVRGLLVGCEVLILESNHDPEMLEQGPYPKELKERLRGPSGHLSNRQAAELLSAVAGPRTRALLLAHLSRTNNRADLALTAALSALDGHSARIQVMVTDQDQLGGWIEV